jgi:hypothetical protein
LLQLEHAIASELHDAREQFVKQHQTTAFLPGLEPVIEQGNMDLSGIDDDHFHEAESRIVEALRAFAETAIGGINVRRHLFAGDSAQGVALIDLARTKFDVAVMNPPFGERRHWLAGGLSFEKRQIRVPTPCRVGGRQNGSCVRREWLSGRA